MDISDSLIPAPQNPYNEDSQNDEATETVIQHRHVFVAGSMQHCLGTFCTVSRQGLIEIP